MKVFHILFTAVMLLGWTFASAQPRHPGESKGQGQIEKLKTMRLIEILKLNEEEAARFVVKQRQHDDNVRAVMDERNKRIDEVQDLIEGGKDKADLSKKSEEILAMDKKIFDERERYYQEMGKFLTPEQFAKFIIFERNFNRKVRDAIEEMRDRFREPKQRD
ncbi:MAG TPA: hypothetical protein VMW43_00720 [Bacteroidota bacterium]|nr:hypothetical protein [Bacteroidota bacterium]